MAQRKQPVVATDTDCRANQYRGRSFDMWNTTTKYFGERGM